VNWVIAGLIAVVVVGIVLGYLMEAITRGLAQQLTVWKVVGTIGLVLVVQGLGSVKFGVLAVRVPKYFPKDTFKLGGAFVGYDQVIVIAISLVGATFLYLFLRSTRQGLAMRSVVDDSALLDLQGTSPVRVRRLASVIGSLLASLSGVLIVPFTGLEPIALTYLVVAAFAAAAIGWFSSIPATYIGGVLLGIIQSVATKYSIDHVTLTGLPDGIPFIALFVVLLVTPRRRLVPPSSVIKRPRLDYHAPGAFRLATFAVVFALLSIVPQTVGLKLPFWTNGIAESIVLLSLGLLVRTARLVSLGTTAFAGIAAVAFSQFVINFHIPWLIALVLAAAVTLPVGAALAIPAIRLHGVFLALATLGAGIMIERFVYPRGWMFTLTQRGQPMPRPSWAEDDKAYYYLALAILFGSCLLVSAIQRGRLGRMLRGLGEAPTAVGTLGLTANMTRVIVFCVSAFLAGIGGIVHGSAVHFAIATDPIYTSFNSLILLAILAISPFREPWFALIGGIGAAVIPGYLTQEDTTYWMNVVFGVSAIVVAVQGGPIGMPKRIAAFVDGLVPERLRRSSSVGERENDREILERVRAGRSHTSTGLEVRDLTVSFGGIAAVQDVSLSAAMGRITGLIGPNGAGKTTLFNACSGLNRPTRGAVSLSGRELTSSSPAVRARAGLGRTFQIMELAESLTVFDNVALGREAGQAATNPLTQMFSRPQERRVVEAAVREALDLCGIADLAGRQAGELSTGERRLVELARCLAGPFDLLLLDEPSSGLDRAETARFGEVLHRVVADRGCGMLLVEHDMGLVMNVCSYLYVLDFGHLIFEGTPAETARSAVVQSAYLGEQDGDGGLESVRSQRTTEEVS
jgi:ABC-type branched-subunit amino acid transport system ATPase component/branched-subunit amino acid ABC-type transport system permease component